MPVRQRISLAGVPVLFAWRWLALTGAVAAITAHELAPELHALDDSLAWYGRVLLVVIGAIGSLLAHELAHALVARRTAGTMTAIEPAMFGALSDEAFAPADPSAEARVALAGPVASLLLAGLFGAAALAAESRAGALAGVCAFLALLNGAIAALNLIPGYPFDGGRVLRALVWYLTDDLVTGARVAAFYGQVVMFFGFFGGFTLLAAGEPYAIWGAWTMLAFWAVSGAAREGVARTVWREMGRRLTIEEAGLAASSRIDGALTIDAGIDDLLQTVGHGPTLVVDGGEIVGVFSLALVHRVPRVIWTERHIRDVARPLDALRRIDSQASVNELFDLFDADPDGLVLVETRGLVSGAVDRDFASQRLRQRVRVERRPPIAR